MAIFGFHFVVTLIAVTVFSKLNSRFSICEWAVIRGLYYYLLQGSLMSPPKALNGRDQKQRRKNIPQEYDDRLVRLPLTSNALEGVPFFTSLSWVYNYFTFALAVYIVSDTFGWFFPLNRDRNTSVIWILCGLLFFVHVLVRLTAVKLSSSELGAERNVIVCFTAVIFLATMVFVMFSDGFLDVELQRAYRQLATSLNDFLTAHGYNDSVVVSATSSAWVSSSFDRSSPLFFLIGLTTMFTIVGAALLFPNFQYASQYLELSESQNQPLVKFGLHAAFFLPMFTFLMYTRPIKEHFMRTSGISNSSLDALRVLLVVVWAFARCAVAHLHFQLFLDQPTRKLIEWRQRNTNIKPEECRIRVAHYASYFCAAALQYFLPVFVTLSTALLLKNLAGIEFTSLKNWSLEKASLAVDEIFLSADSAESTGTQALDILLSAPTQKALWTLCLVGFLSIQSALSIVGVVFKRIDMSRI